MACAMGIAQAEESPLLGGGLGQTLRVTIVATGDVCDATVGFRDIRGTPVPEDGRGTPVPDDGRDQPIFLKAGQTAYRDLNFNRFVTRLGQRYEVRAVVVFPPDPVRAQCRWSAEIFDQFSKRTTLMYGHPPQGVPVPEDGHLSPIGGAFGQIVRLAAVAGSEVCAVEVDFHSATGALLASKLMKLAPGEADVLDLNMNSLVRFGERGIIDPCFMPIAPGTAAACKFSVQVFDQFTGWTQALSTQ